MYSHPTYKYKEGMVTGLVAILHKNCFLKYVFQGKNGLKAVADGKTRKNMKAATGLTYVDGTFIESEVLMASKVSNLVVWVITSVRK